MGRDAQIEQMYSTLHETVALFDQPDAVLNRSYGPSKWTLRELLVHLSDTETVLLDRLRRIASENNPPLVAFDENLWTKNLFYAKRDLTLARQQFEVARRNAIELAKTLDASVDVKTGVHSEVGALTFATILGKVGAHNAHHLEQCRAIVAGKTWTKK
jgi:hypothetical protein